MNKRMKIFSLACMLGILTTFSVYANNSSSVSDGGKPSETVPSDKDIGQIQFYDERGVWISSGSVSITNAGQGKIGVSIDTLCHVPVDKIYMTVYIDMLNEEGTKWILADYKSFEYSSNTAPGGKLSDASESFHVSGLPVNRYYRLRGVHAVYQGGKSEGYNTETNGILITKDPY